VYDVTRSRELQAAVALLKQAPTRVRAAMKRRARVRLNALWKPRLEARASSKLQQRVIVGGARSKVGNDEFSMLAATSRRALSGGLVPADDWHGAELGAHIRTVEVTIEGRTRNQKINKQLPRRNREGLVAFPVARKVGPEVVAEWVDGVVEGAFEGVDAETVRG
jgi:hypothetical protein